MKLAIAINSKLSNFLFPPKTYTYKLFRFPNSQAFLSSSSIPKSLFKNLCRTTMAVKSSTLTTQSSSPFVHVKDRIDLTYKEEQIFDRLLQVLGHFSLQTQLRVAGGWVRDKLLGKECDDIDIALDNMLGKEFCEKVNEYLLSSGEEPEGIGVIQCNPEQSKHLETATMRLCGVKIDFVNLRAEDYAENSRIPTMRFGTAKEDAYRRDLTINSLFYNINSNVVEDFTGRGIADLKSGKIVTPLPAKQTFLDDPLRVLRAIRFGARFCFELDEELKKAASDEDVKAAITGKISRERIGHEIDLMISGNQPVKAMAYISELQLFWSVFTLPPEIEPSIPDGCDRLCVAYVDYAWRFLQMIEHSFTVDQRSLCLYAAFFVPFRETVYRDKKGRKIPVVNHIVRNSLKQKAKVAEMVISLHIAAQKFISLIPFIMDKEHLQNIEVDWKIETIDVPVASKLRILAGLLLRDIEEFWHAALLLSFLLYPDDIGPIANTSSVQSELEKRVKLYNMIEDAIQKQGLDKVWEVKPLINGKEIMSILNLKTGGPLVKEWQQKLLEWQLAHPSGNAEECTNWMLEAHSKRAKWK